jgi:hypothetical protein
MGDSPKYLPLAHADRQLMCTGAHHCDEGDQSLSPLTLCCSIEYSLTNRCCLVSQSPPSAVANYLTIRHKQLKITLLLKGTMRHNDAVLALSLSLA